MNKEITLSNMEEAPLAQHCVIKIVLTVNADLRFSYILILKGGRGVSVLKTSHPNSSMWKKVNQLNHSEDIT